MNISTTKALIQDITADTERLETASVELGTMLPAGDVRRLVLTNLAADVNRATVELKAAANGLDAGDEATQQRARAALAAGEALQRRSAALVRKLGGQLSTPGGPGTAPAMDKFAEMEDTTERLGQRFRERRVDPRGTNGEYEVESAVLDISTYPTLTTEVGDGGRPAGPIGPGSSGGGGGSPRSVDAAIRATIGRLPRYTDGKAFLSALNQSFTIAEVGGQRVVSWRRHSTAGQGELGGGVTGAQASLHSQARDALAAVRPLLEGLRPLRSDPDLQEMEAAREIVLSAFTSVVGELGAEGGPRTARVDQLFALLMKDRVIAPDDDGEAEGMVAYLQQTFGLHEELVNTLDEETLFTDFVSVQDRIRNIQDLWCRYKDRTRNSDLGTRLVLLSRALQVVAEGVDEIEAALDSVFVGESERRVVRFDGDDGHEMLVADLLSWVRAFASEEAPEMVQTAGRRGVGSIVGTTVRLGSLVQHLVAAASARPSGLPDGMRHPRVLNPLRDLITYLEDVAVLAGDVAGSPAGRTALAHR